MRAKWFFLSALVLLVGYAHLPGQKPDLVKDTPAFANSHFCLSSNSQDTVLLDSTNGSSWLLCKSADGKAAWLPLPILKTEKDACQWQKDHALVQLQITKKEQAMSAIGTALEGMGYRRIHLDRLKSGYLCTNVKVDGKNLYLVIDTGAPNTHLDLKRGEKLKFEWSKIKYRTENGAELESAVLNARSIEIGSFQSGPLAVMGYDLSEANERLKLNKDQSIDGVLGADVLDRHLAVIDFLGGNLYLLSRGVGEQSK